MAPINNRYDFVYLFDVTQGNPNGDPDNGNAPRQDIVTGRGIVTGMCLKRKIRNYIQMEGDSLFIEPRQPLNRKIADACDAVGQPS